MATKSQLLAQLNQEEITDDFRTEIEGKLSEYPEELSEQHLIELDQYLLEVQQIELEFAKASDDMANALVDSEVESTNNELDLVNESVNIVASELRHANTMMDLMEKPQAETQPAADQSANPNT
jgi:hypothetical protein